MRVRVLGCYGAELSNRNTCGFLINGSVLVDAGTICSSLTLSEQDRIRYILLSHIHADHIKGLSLLSENLSVHNPKRPVVIMSLPEVLDGLQRYLFNDQIWPDFTKIPSEQNPVFRMRAIREEETIRIAGLDVRAFSVNHIVPCAGFLIRQENASLLYSGDTSHTDKIWKAAAQDDHLKAAIVETSFPNALTDLAIRSKHLTPDLLLQEFSKIGKPHLPLYTYHMKPRYLQEIRQELERLKIKNLTVLEDGMIFDV